jgi:glycosyltransferase involved in cell wall biosynthesis
MMNVTVVIPSLNPDEKIVNTVKGLIEEGFKDIIVVDDGSAPKYKKYFKEVQKLDEVKVLVHKENKGKGRAMKTAFRYIPQNRKDTKGVVTVDGDGQHLPKDIKKCVDEMGKYGDKVILGVRDFSNPSVPFKSRFGNNLTKAVFKLCGISISDTQTGLRAIPYKYLRFMIIIEGERYEYETKQLLELKRMGIDMKEVVIDTVYINDNEGTHFNPIKDSIKIYKVIFRHMLKKADRPGR